MKRNVLTALPVAGIASVAAPLVAHAEGPTVVSSTDWAPIITAMTGQISVTTVVGVISTAIGAGIGLVFMWWGGRKLSGLLCLLSEKVKCPCSFLLFLGGGVPSLFFYKVV